MNTKQWQFTIEKGVKNDKQAQKTKWYTYIPSVNEEDKELYLHKRSLTQKNQDVKTYESSFHSPISKPNPKKRKSSVLKEFMNVIEFEYDLLDLPFHQVPLYSDSTLISCNVGSTSTTEHPKNENAEFLFKFFET